MTPRRFNFAGGEIKMGVLNVSVAVSISSAIPWGIARELKLTFVSSTKD